MPRHTSYTHRLGESNLKVSLTSHLHPHSALLPRPRQHAPAPRGRVPSVPGARVVPEALGVQGPRAGPRFQEGGGARGPAVLGGLDDEPVTGLHGIWGEKRGWILRLYRLFGIKIK